jgi:hypothetical protein
MSANKKSSRLTPKSIKELNKLFSRIPPKAMEEVLTRLYMTYFADDEADLSEEFQRFYKPLYLLIITLKKMEMRKS